MGRERTGFIVERNGKIYVRVQYTDDSGVRRELMRRAGNRTEAQRLRKSLIKDLEDHGETVLHGDHIRFVDLARDYEKDKLFPAKIVNGRKVAGVKSVQPARAALKALVSGFGKRRIKAIRHGDIQDYKVARLDTPTIHRNQRSIASVNRELELLRAMFRYAMRQGWIVSSPFQKGDSLISKADETSRDRTLTYDEEQRLLAAFDKPKRKHLRPLLIAALDTACRRGELFKLRWRDVDFVSRILTVTVENAKTATRREVGMTSRLYDELMKLWQVSTQDERASVFGITTTIKTAFKSACEEAGIKDFHFHDGRHTATTRMVETGQPHTLIMKVTGHTQYKTFVRYVNPSATAITGVAEALGAFNTNKQTDEQRSSGMVN
ncbi:MAG TPA: site-specific integrase [Pyrinomonadaceae bacterium]|nr:site-specific integrase [Pyrinomonadaceae bacterium]